MTTLNHSISVSPFTKHVDGGGIALSRFVSYYHPTWMSQTQIDRRNEIARDHWQFIGIKRREDKPKYFVTAEKASEADGALVMRIPDDFDGIYSDYDFMDDDCVARFKEIGRLRKVKGRWRVVPSELYDAFREVWKDGK